MSAVLRKASAPAAEHRQQWQQGERLPLVLRAVCDSGQPRWAYRHADGPVHRWTHYPSEVLRTGAHSKKVHTPRDDTEETLEQYKERIDLERRARDALDHSIEQHKEEQYIRSQQEQEHSGERAG